ncbi:MAG TPA: aminotransferase class III-fold pyridoxal phosphate-dependent enzyme, partial [Sphingomicrobium sp.]|nr:aminotransferase class III-fold pyridoxal phosphate-dependent enzyme [Sphingomicrobium sp.]
MAITPLMPVYPRSPVRPVRGEGVYLYGEQGEKYLDFAAGIAVNLLGHGHPHLTKALQEQAATLIHVSNLYGSPQGEAFAQRLVDLTFADTVFFTNSGAEAVECSIKTARRYHHAKGNPHKNELITFSNAFHGRTMATISATNQVKMID